MTGWFRRALVDALLVGLVLAAGAAGLIAGITQRLRRAGRPPRPGTIATLDGWQVAARRSPPLEAPGPSERVH